MMKIVLTKTVNIALAYNHVSVMGVIYVPVTGNSERHGEVIQQVAFSNYIYVDTNRNKVMIVQKSARI